MTTLDHRLPNGTIPLLLSADATDLLRTDAAALLTYVEEHSDITAQAVADMLFRTRTPRRHRALGMVTGRDDLIGVLRAIAADGEHSSLVRTTRPTVAGRIGYVFPGQGSQRPGMGRLFYDSVPAFRDEADRCAAVFEEQFGSSPLKYLLDEQFPADDTARTVQPALFTQMAALAAMWRAYGVAPDITVGHSQGEIAAAYVAQTMSLPDAVRVVAIRAQAADEFTGGDYAMAVIATGRDDCEDVLARCDGWAQLSVVNSPNMIGISGERTAVQRVVDVYTERGVFARVIRVRYPAHTMLMNDIGDAVRADMRRRLDNPKFVGSEVDCIGSTLGGPIGTDLGADQYWFLNLRNTVRFDRAVAAAAVREIDTFVELAEHPTLHLAITENLAATAADHAGVVVGTSVRTADSLDEFTHNLMTAAVHIPDYPWQNLGRRIDGPAPLPLLDFPNSPMRQFVSWLPYMTESSQVATVSSTERPAAPAPTPSAGAAPRLLAETWHRLSHRSLLPPRTIGIVDHSGSFPTLVPALCSAAADIGASARPIDVDDPADRAGLDTVVILLPQSPPMDDAAAAGEVAAFFGNRAWWPGLDGTVTACWLVTVGGESVVEGDPPPGLVAAAASAGFRSVGAEHAGVRFRHLDLPATTPSAIEIVTSLHTDGETELAWRDGALYAKRVVELDSLAPDAGRYEHVVIVGGTGNVGLEVCDHYARRGVHRITLVNRSGETAAVAERLRRIRAATSTAIGVAACDVGDPDAVARLAGENRSTPADLIVHAAVVFTGNELGDITVERVDEALRAKVVGIWRILETFPRTDACRVLLCSSIGANVGGRGLIVYAAANRMLDAMAHRRRAEGLDCVAVQWGHWAVTFDPEAEHTARLGSTGLVPMAAESALATGLGRHAGNVIVASFDLERARSVLDICGRASLLSELRSEEAVAPASGRGADLSQRFVELVATTIGVDAADSIDTTLPLVAIGLDSLQALEIRRRVKAEFGHDLEVSDLLGGASLDDVLGRLVG